MAYSLSLMPPDSSARISPATTNQNNYTAFLRNVNQGFLMPFPGRANMSRLGLPLRCRWAWGGTWRLASALPRPMKSVRKMLELDPKNTMTLAARSRSRKPSSHAPAPAENASCGRVFGATAEYRDHSEPVSEGQVT
jgi:hypothetical protein